MADCTKSSGDTNYTLRGPQFFREETRVWYVNVDATLSTVISVKVYENESDATAGNANNSAGGTQVITAGETGTRTVTLTNTANAPTFTGARIDVEITTAVTGGEEAVWTVDLGPRLERAVLRVLRGFNTYVDGGDSYLHDIDTAELGVRMWENVEGDGDVDFPYVGVARASVTRTRGEIGHGGHGGGVQEILLECEAHNALTEAQATVDSNAMWLFHDLRRALTDLEEETYTGDGKVYGSAVAQLANPDRPVEWARDRVTVAFDVVITLQESRSEVAAG